MFPLGHLGIGLKTAQPFKRGLPLKPLLLGTLLPDLIDKPLYHGLALATGRQGAELGIVAGTRSFGHTLLFTAALWALARARRSKALAALALGASTHLLLDLVTDAFIVPAFFKGGAADTSRILAWPLLGWQFPFTTRGLFDHLGHVFNPFILSAEILGALILLWECRQARRKAKSV
jgi:hypothetical protein